MKHQELAKHFYSRFAFSIPFQTWNNLGVGFSAEEALEEMLREKNLAPLYAKTYIESKDQTSMMSEEEKKKAQKEDRQSMLRLNGDWIASITYSNNILADKLTLFWHDHFACKPKTVKMGMDQINLIRKNAMGNFGTLVHEIARDPAMLLYLNNQQNRKQKPNENFARELMELFTLGIDQYTEEDIKEAARAFTGWGIDRHGNFILRKGAHDYGAKNFMGKTGNWNGDDIINFILEKKRTAEYISGKLARYFIGPSINPSDLKEFTEVFYEANYEVKPLLRAIVRSNSFQNPKNFGNDIASQVELLVRLERDFNLDFEGTKGRLYIQRTLGQVLLQPPNVSGWPSGKSWIDTSTLLVRMRLSRALLLNEEIKAQAKASFAKGEDLADGVSGKASKFLSSSADLSEIEKAWKGIPWSEKVRRAAQWLLPEKFHNTQILTGIAHMQPPKETETAYALALVAALPEYQLK
jgi:uncharacterized protein (DUF1800 family)